MGNRWLVAIAFLMGILPLYVDGGIKSKIDAVGDVECPENPLLPPSKLLVVVCCAAKGQSVQQVRADGVQSKEEDWTKELRYCKVTLKKLRNKGLESSAYLNFFITRYNDLPEMVVMVHGNNGWHDHVNKKILLAPNFTTWLSTNHGFIPFPSPLTHDGNIDTRNAATISMQNFYDSQLRQALHLPAQRICDPGQDRIHYCCAQFVLSRESIQRNRRVAYLKLREYVYRENHDYRTSREMEHSWPILFTGKMGASPSLLTAVEDWRRSALLAPCRPWQCDCQRLSDLYRTSLANRGKASNEAWAWFHHGLYDWEMTQQQVSVLTSLSSSNPGLYTPSGRDHDGRCQTFPH